MTRLKNFITKIIKANLTAEGGLKSARRRRQIEENRRRIHSDVGFQHIVKPEKNEYSEFFEVPS